MQNVKIQWELQNRYCIDYKHSVHLAETVTLETRTNLWKEEEVSWSTIKSPQSTKEPPDFNLQWENADTLHDYGHFCWMLPSMSHCSWPLSTYIYVSSTHGSNKTNKVELYSIQIPCCSDHFIALYNKDVNMGFLSTTGQISHHTETFIFSKDEKQTYLRASNLSLPGSNRHTIFLPLAAKSRLQVKDQHRHLLFVYRRQGLMYHKPLWQA